MTSKIFFVIAFYSLSFNAFAEKTIVAPQTEEQCKKNIEKLIKEHKSISNPATPDAVPDDSFVENLKKIQVSKGSCEAYNQFLDSYN
jgi:hypothetical protein